MKKTLILFLGLYLLLALQTSFFVHLGFLKNFPSLAIILFILINLLERGSERTGLFLSLFLGFILDIFTNKPLGFYGLILLTVSFLIKFGVKKYVRVPLRKRF